MNKYIITKNGLRLCAYRSTMASNQAMKQLNAIRRFYIGLYPSHNIKLKKVK